MATGRIEHWPDNGSAQHVVLIETQGKTLAFACQTLAQAEAKLPKMLDEWREIEAAPAMMKAW